MSTSTQPGTTSDETERTIIDILCSVLDTEPEDFRSDTLVTAQEEWCSLVSLETLVALERGFDVKLDLRAYYACRTVADLVDLVTRALNPSSAA